MSTISNHKSMFRAALAVSASLGALCVGAPAFAQDAAKPADAAAVDVNEIVVTAQFRSQKLQDVPIAITAISGATLEARSQSSLVDVAKQAPSVQLTDLGGAFGPSMAATIRGVGQGDFDPALEPGVGMYIDDVYYSSLMGSNFALIDLDRVEVLRGPQGTLSGRNSEGGSIKMFSKKPGPNTDGNFSVGYGSYKAIDVRGAANLTLAPEALYMRISGVAHDDDGYMRRVDYGCAFPGSGVPAQAAANGLGCTVGRQGGKTYVAGRLALRYAPTGSPFEVNVSGDYTKDTSQVAATRLLSVNEKLTLGGYLDANNNIVPPGCPSCAVQGGVNPVGGGPIYLNSSFIPNDPYVTYANRTDFIAGKTYTAPEKTRTTSWGGSAVIDWKLADSLALKSITAYREFDSTFSEDNDSSPAQVSLGFEHLFNHSFSQELRLSGSFGDSKFIEYTLGGYYFKQTTTYPTHQLLNYAGGLAFYGNDPVNAGSKAAFLNGVYHILPGLDFNGGIRYTSEEKTYHYVRLADDGINPAPLVGSVNGQSATYKGHHWDYRANLNYHVTDDVMVYGSFSTGFKGGGTNPRPFFGPTPFGPGTTCGTVAAPQPNCQLQPFGAETLKAYEIGVKSSFFDHRLTLNLSGYVNKISNLQATVLNCPQYSPPGFLFPGGPPFSVLCALPVNAGNATVKGFEVETVLRPIDGLTLDGSYSYIDFKYDNILASTGITTNSVAPGLPQHSKWAIGAQYELPIGDVGSVTARIDMTHQDFEFTNVLNAATNKLPAYTLVNGRITVASHDNDWEIALAATNLTNKAYLTSNFDLYGSAGFTYGTVGRPREFSVSVKHKF
jgi:iron complex outermembrane recepter protein